MLIKTNTCRHLVPAAISFMACLHFHLAQTKNIKEFFKGCATELGQLINMYSEGPVIPCYQPVSASTPQQLPTLSPPLTIADHVASSNLWPLSSLYSTTLPTYDHLWRHLSPSRGFQAPGSACGCNGSPCPTGCRIRASVSSIPLTYQSILKIPLHLFWPFHLTLLAGSFRTSPFLNRQQGSPFTVLG